MNNVEHDWTIFGAIKLTEVDLIHLLGAIWLYFEGFHKMLSYMRKWQLSHCLNGICERI